MSGFENITVAGMGVFDWLKKQIRYEEEKGENFAAEVASVSYAKIRRGKYKVEIAYNKRPSKGRHLTDAEIRKEYGMESKQYPQVKKNVIAFFIRNYGDKFYFRHLHTKINCGKSTLSAALNSLTRAGILVHDGGNSGSGPFAYSLRPSTAVCLSDVDACIELVDTLYNEFLQSDVNKKQKHRRNKKEEMELKRDLLGLDAVDEKNKSNPLLMFLLDVLVSIDVAVEVEENKYTFTFQRRI